jgi:hypothetical protein
MTKLCHLTYAQNRSHQNGSDENAGTVIVDRSGMN